MTAALERNARESGVEPGRRDYASTIEFADPDGNTWVVQEIGHGASVRHDATAGRATASAPSNGKDQN